MALNNTFLKRIDFDTDPDFDTDGLLKLVPFQSALIVRMSQPLQKSRRTLLRLRSADKGGGLALSTLPTSKASRGLSWGSLARLLLTGTLLLAVAGCGESHPAWDAEGRTSRLMESLDLGHPELGPLIARWQSNRSAEAVAEVIAYFRERPLPQSLQPETPPVDGYAVERAGLALQYRFILQGVEGDASHPDGGIDWTSRGPRHDREWSWMLNRHGHFADFLQAWRQTGDERYLKGIEAHLGDWIDKHPAPRRFTFSAAWRALEAARRVVDNWMAIYPVVQEETVFSDRLRIDLLASLAQHGDYLRHHHHYGGNHLITEMMALATLARGWPEFRNAPDWLAYAIEILEREVDRQVYPDGAHKELANHYQWIAAQSLERFLDLFEPDDPQVASLRQKVETMWDFFAHSTQPNGFGPLNNDSDREPNAAHLLGVNQRYQRMDWEYIRSRGAWGTPPEGGPSTFFPWAGMWFARSGWDGDAHWSLFSVGPYGTDHQHDDHLHLSVSLGDLEMLVDSGRYTYRDNVWARAFRHAGAHNSVLIDGRGGVTADRQVRRPIEGHYLQEGPFQAALGRNFFGWGGGAESVWSSIDGWRRTLDPFASGRAWHDRVALYRDQGYWIVIDRVELFKPQAVEVHWRFHPDRVIEIDEASFGSEGEARQLRIFPLGDTDWSYELIRGQTEPEPMGWHAPAFNQREAATVVRAEARVSQPETFAWVLWPRQPDQPEPAIEARSFPGGIEVTVAHGQTLDRVALSWRQPGPSDIRWERLGQAWIRWESGELELPDPAEAAPGAEGHD